MNTKPICDRFEREGILRLERGLNLDAHFDQCATCEVARHKYETLLEALPSAEPDVAPKPGWQSKVLQAAVTRETSRPVFSLAGFGRPFGWTALAAAGAMAAWTFVSAPHAQQFEVQAETHASTTLPELAVEEPSEIVTGDNEPTNAQPLPAPRPVAPKAQPKTTAPMTAATTSQSHDTTSTTPAAAKPAPVKAQTTITMTSSSSSDGSSKKLQVIRPDKLYGLAIKYPHAAMKAKVQGETSVQCTIRADGRNENCRILKSLPHLDSAVIRAVESARSEPIRVNGKAVDHSDHIWHITITLREIVDDRTSARGLPTLNWN